MGRCLLLLGGNFDEFLEELHALAELRAQTHLCDHPELDLVKPAQEQVQVHRGFLNVLPPKGVIDELKLTDIKKGGKQNTQHEVTCRI